MIVQKEKKQEKSKDISSSVAITIQTEDTQHMSQKRKIIIQGFKRQRNEDMRDI